MNLFMANADFNKIRGMHLYAWKRGLKTGIYYLRTLAVAKAQQVTVDQSLMNGSVATNTPTPYKKPTRPVDDADCLMCSS
jgi:ribonucleotide reductase alpha subunit